MQLAHLPAGFLSLYFTRKIWQKNLTKKQVKIIFFIGLIFSVLPDIDIFYYFLFDAQTLHREFISHTPLIYLVFVLVIYLFAWIKKSNFLRSFSQVFALGSFTHFLCDSLANGVPWLYPWDKNIHGLNDLKLFYFSWPGQHPIIFNYILELFIIIFALTLLIFLKFKDNKVRFVTISVAILLFLSSFLGLIYLDRDIYEVADLYYRDFDHDGLVNIKDSDIDGDGIKNIEDPDANGNGKINQEDLTLVIERLKGVRYDPLQGRFWQIGKRLGFLTNIELVKKSYDALGIYLGYELVQDFQIRPENYQKFSKTTSKDYQFLDQPKNFYIFCQNNNFFIKDRPQFGDIIFYGDNFYVALISHVNNKNFDVLEARPGHKVDEVSNSELVQREGEVKAICRILR